MRKYSEILLSATLLVSLFSHHIHGYGGGADESVCDTMIPGHDVDPQTSENPYKIVLSKTSVMGFETVDIKLTSKNGADTFKGFLIQVRKPGEQKSIGQFNAIAEETNAKVMKCFGLDKSAMTHSNPTPKNSITARWTAPNDADGEYDVYYTVVGANGGTFWTANVHPEKIRVARNAQATTQAPKKILASDAVLEKWRTIYNGCGSSKGCFGIPGKCVEEYDSKSNEPVTCEMMVTWELKGGRNVFEMTGRYGVGDNGYIAVGISEDASMGKDSVVGCSFRGGRGEVKRYFNDNNKVNQGHSPNNLGLAAISNPVLEDGNLFCSFEQTNHKVDEIDVNFRDNKYFYLLSRAPSMAETRLPRHPSGVDRDASPQSVHISERIIMGADPKTWLIQLHGALMLIAWILCASTGMFTARYFKQTHTSFMPFGKAFWFILHVFCMATTAFLTICGIIFILIKKKGVELRETHTILGTVVIGLAILQVIIAQFRPHPGTSTRPIFNWIHWGIGNAAHIVGITCIFFAWELPLADLQERFSEEYLWFWILMAVVLFHILMHFVMSIHTLWADSQLNAANRKRAVFPGPMKGNGMNSEAPGTGFRTFMFGLYLCGMAAGAIALVVLVFWPKDTGDEPTS